MNFKTVSFFFNFSCPSVPPFVIGFTFIPSFNVLNGYFMFRLIWWRFLLFEFVKLHDLTSLKHFHLSVNDLIGSFLYYNVYTTLLSRIFQIVHIACGLWKRGFTLRFFLCRENYLFTCTCPKCESEAGDPDVTSSEDEDDSMEEDA